jgi:hypothetical protein
MNSINKKLFKSLININHKQDFINKIKVKNILLFYL